MEGMLAVSNIRSRLNAVGIHFGISFLVALGAAALVFGIWYPWPYREISGGQELFMLVVSVDLVLGPALTLIVFNRAKPRAELIRDLAVIAVLQLAGLCYGIYSLFEARPVALVYEPGRFRVVTNANLLHEELSVAPQELRSLSVAGPRLLGTREPRNAEEKLNSVDFALQGFDVGQRPSYWQAFDASREHARTETRPLDLLVNKYPQNADEIANYVREMGRAQEDVGFLPVIAKRADWSVIVDRKSGEPIGFVPLDGFF